MRFIPVILAVGAVAACSGASAGPIEGSSMGRGAGSPNGGDRTSDASAACSASSKTQGIGAGPAPVAPAPVVFDITNRSDHVLYVVNDDGEHEMLEVARGSTIERLSVPPVVVCGATMKISHEDRFLFAVPVGGTRTVGGWDKRVVSDAGTLCVVCANEGRPDLGVEIVSEYDSVNAPPGTYTATVKVLDTLPAGCTAVSGVDSGFHCVAWAGANALQTRSSQVSIEVRDVGEGAPSGANEEHIAVSF